MVGAESVFWLCSLPICCHSDQSVLPSRRVTLFRATTPESIDLELEGDLGQVPLQEAGVEGDEIP
jgi:hypothetical protein